MPEYFHAAYIFGCKRNTEISANKPKYTFLLLTSVRLLSSRIHVILTNSPLPPQEATTRPAAVSYDDNVLLPGDPRPLSATYNPRPHSNSRSLYPNSYDRYIYTYTMYIIVYN